MEVTVFNFISVIALVFALGGIGAYFIGDNDQDDRDDGQDDYMTENRRMINDASTSSYDDEWIKEAFKVQTFTDTTLGEEITKLETKLDATTPTNNNVMTLQEKNQIINEINSLKSKMSTAEKNIEDLEDDIDDNRSSSSSTRNTFSTPSCIDFDDNTDRTVTIDRFRETDLDDDVVFTGIGEPREQVELWICQPDDRTPVSGGNIRIPSDGEWTINCQARVCAGETGDHIAFIEIIGSGDLSRIMEYEVER